MMSLTRSIFWSVALWFLSNQNLFAQTIRPSSYDHNVVIVPEGQSRTFMFTNRKGLFYYGETGLPNTSPYNGLSYLTHEFLEDYIIEIGGNPLSRSQAEVHMMGDKLIRKFKNPSLEEEISMADSLPILLIKISSKQRFPIALVPLITGSNQQQDFIIDWSSQDKVLFIARKDHLAGNNGNNYPSWLGICTYPEADYTIVGLKEPAKKPKLVQQQIFSPGKVTVYLESEVVILFIIGDSKNDLLRSRNLIFKELNIDIKRQNSQIEGIRQAQSHSDLFFTLLGN